MYKDSFDSRHEMEISLPNENHTNTSHNAKKYASLSHSPPQRNTAQTHNTHVAKMNHFFFFLFFSFHF